MRITIASVGRFGAGPERALYEHYRRRVGWEVALREVVVSGASSTRTRVEREAAALAAACPAGARRVALDAGGRALTSEAFATEIEALRDGGVRDLAFLIGGADGLAREIVEGAADVLAFGAATWPHLLVRGMLMEQIYRAQQILAAHPYHRGVRRAGRGQ